MCRRRPRRRPRGRSGHRRRHGHGQDGARHRAVAPAAWHRARLGGRHGRLPGPRHRDRDTCSVEPAGPARVAPSRSRRARARSSRWHNSSRRRWPRSTPSAGAVTGPFSSAARASTTGQSSMACSCRTLPCHRGRPRRGGGRRTGLGRFPASSPRRSRSRGGLPHRPGEPPADRAGLGGDARKRAGLLELRPGARALPGPPDPVRRAPARACRAEPAPGRPARGPARLRAGSTRSVRWRHGREGFRERPCRPSATGSCSRLSPRGARWHRPETPSLSG